MFCVFQQIKLWNTSKGKKIKGNENTITATVGAPVKTNTAGFSQWNWVFAF